MDSTSRGFLATPPPPDRYEHTYDPDEASGIICQLIPARARVLDVGCGNGSLAVMIQRRCEASVIGIEPDPDRAALAQGRGLEVTLGKLEDAMEPSQGGFDVVLLADVLEHVPAPFEMVEQVLRCLHPSGHIVVSVPNAVHWSVRLMISSGRFEYEPSGILDSTHLRWFTAESLVRFMERVGCTVDTVRFSLGHTARCYDRRPWCWIPDLAKRRVIRLMTRAMPGLFGWQVILKAGLTHSAGVPVVSCRRVDDPAGCNGSNAPGGAQDRAGG